MKFICRSVSESADKCRLEAKNKATDSTKFSSASVPTSDIKKKRTFRKDLHGCTDDVLANPDEVRLSNEYKNRDNPESRLNNWISI